MVDIPASVDAQRTRRHTDGMIKTWEDVARYAMVIDEVRPAVVVECGSYTGASAAWFRQRVPLVVSVDISPPTLAEADGVRFVPGSSVDPSVVDDVRALVGNRSPVLVSLDSDHSPEHVYREMVLYSELVTPGSYMVVEDGIFRYIPEQAARFGGTPLDAIERFLAERDDFRVDTILEDAFPQTQFPSGWLRRVE